MKCWIFANDVLIGCSILYPKDPSMGVFGGSFQPTEVYRTLQPDAEVLTRTGAPAIRLTARMDDGRLLSPVAGIFMEEVSDLDLHDVVLCGLAWDEVPLLE